jgi:hypothetical protein
MPQFVETLESLRWMLVVMYLCIVGGVGDSHKGSLNNQGKPA